MRRAPVVLERAGGFSRAEINVILRLVHEHRGQLLERCMSPSGIEIQEAGAQSVTVTDEALSVISSMVELSSYPW